jgi:hypothetical protein
MGRPLNKKYFGNRNIGSASTTADNGIGGQAIASISNPAGGVGSFSVNNTYKNFPQLNIGAPTIPGGVQATADVVFEINTVTFSSGGQTNADYVAGLSTTITGLGGGAIVNITEVASKVTAVDVTTAGTNRGEFRRGDAFDGTGITTFQVLQAPNAGTDLQINITFRVKSITIVEQGSGYVTVPNLSWNGHTFTGQTSPSLNAVTFATDTGSAGTVTNDENAIICTAFIPAANGGTAAVIGDIVKQSNDKRYKVKTAEGTGICRLKTTGAASAAGEMSIKATDSAGGNYLVAKLTARKVVLVPAALGGSAGTQFASGASAKWTFGSAVLNDTVTIENA